MHLIIKGEKTKRGILLIAIALFAVIFFSACIQQSNLDAEAGSKMLKKCCNECSAAFSKSPIGVGPEGAFCGAFMTAEPMSKECEKYFGENQKTVAECEK